MTLQIITREQLLKLTSYWCLTLGKLVYQQPTSMFIWNFSRTLWCFQIWHIHSCSEILAFCAFLGIQKIYSKCDVRLYDTALQSFE